MNNFIDCRIISTNFDGRGIPEDQLAVTYMIQTITQIFAGIQMELSFFQMKLQNKLKILIELSLFINFHLKEKKYF